MKLRTMGTYYLLLGTALTLFSAHMAFGHVKIFPTESTYGIRERYMMRWPNEKNVKSIRVEGTFPPEINVYDFEYKPGYTIDFKKDEKGKIIGATWTGVVNPNQFIEFGMLALNPAKPSDGTSLTWNFVEYYEDGSKEEYTGPVGSKLPAPVVKMCPAEGCPKAPLTSSN